MIATVRDLMLAIRQGPYTSIGCYPLFFLTNDGDTLHPDDVRADVWREARKIRDGDRDRIVACDINWEDPDMYTPEGRRIESAYAEPESP